uniref:Lipoprotein n=1 Tax=uncultured Thiotrichaceae bacterium TaxID=298394 RepID=A0A6S6UIS7_9GAMM|nr:MAG: Unknown protein [uncultured Thiotrichaceae bacterium]
MTVVKKASGIAIASAAAALLLSGCGSNPYDGGKSTAMSKTEAKVKCSGINSCKGTGACGTAKHDCAGKNACKGQGWIKASKEDCAKKGGMVKG